MKQSSDFRAFGFLHCKGRWACLSKRSRGCPPAVSVKPPLIHTPLPVSSPPLFSSLRISLYVLFISALPCASVFWLCLTAPPRLTRWGTSRDRDHIWAREALHVQNQLLSEANLSARCSLTSSLPRWLPAAGDRW